MDDAKANAIIAAIKDVVAVMEGLRSDLGDYERKRDKQVKEIVAALANIEGHLSMRD